MRRKPTKRKGTRVQVVVYSKQGCKICQSAKEKLSLLGIEYQEKELGKVIQVHTGWETDESVDLLAAYTYLGNHLPVLKINDEYHDYPSAMRRLRDLGVERKKAVAED